MSPTMETTARGEPIQIFIESPGEVAKNHSPGFLARKLGLAVNGRWLLTHRGKIEMTAIGIVLLVIFLFDWMAWTLLFNAILHSEILEKTGLTALAALAGTLFAITVMVYERQFVTSDTSSGWRKQWFPMAIRVCVIVAAALITAQPIELLFFREPIQQRVHEEGVRAHVIALLESFEDAEEKKVEANARTADIEKEWQCRGRQDAQDSLYTAQEVEIELQTRLAGAIGNRDYWKREVERRLNKVTELRNRLERMNNSTWREASFGDAETTSESVPEVRKALKSAEAEHGASESSYEAARGRVFGFQQELKETGLLIGVLEKRLTEKKEECRRREVQIHTDSNKKKEEAVNKQQELRNWIQTLVSSVPEEVDGKSTVVDGVRFPYRLPQYDFFAQLRVLHDLRHGAPPRWPGGTGEDMVQGADKFGLAYPKSCDTTEGGTPRCTNEEKMSWQSVRAQARHLRWAYVAVYGIALVIPSLVFALKLLLPTELVSYYSITRQARAGNPEAQQILAAMTEEV